MKKIYVGVFSLLLFVFIAGCSRNTETQLRISNKHAEKVNVKIQTEKGVKFAINDVEPGETSDYQTINEGNITATAVIQNESISFLVAKHAHYTIFISADKPPLLHLDQ